MKFHLALPLLMIAVLASGASPPSETDRNKAIVMRSEIELWSRGDLAVADQLHAPDFVGHFVVGPEGQVLGGLALGWLDGPGGLPAMFVAIAVCSVIGATFATAAKVGR